MPLKLNMILGPDDKFDDDTTVWDWADFDGSKDCYQCEDTPADVIFDWGDRTEILCAECWDYLVKTDLSGDKLNHVFHIFEYDDREEDCE